MEQCVRRGPVDVVICNYADCDMVRYAGRFGIEVEAIDASLRENVGGSGAR